MAAIDPFEDTKLFVVTYIREGSTITDLVTDDFDVAIEHCQTLAESNATHPFVSPVQRIHFTGREGIYCKPTGRQVTTPLYHPDGFVYCVKRNVYETQAEYDKRQAVMAEFNEKRALAMAQSRASVMMAELDAESKARAAADASSVHVKISVTRTTRTLGLKRSRNT